MDEERYARHALIEGWDQTKLKTRKVAIVGSGVLADFLAIDMISLGIGTVTRIGHPSLAIPFKKINPNERYFECREDIDNPFSADGLIAEQDLLIEASYNEQSKQAVEELARMRSTPYIDVACSSNSLGYACNSRVSSMEGTNSLVSPMLASALVSDEVRKIFLPLPRDTRLPSYSFQGVASPTKLEDKILQVGAGAVGTFTGLFLSHGQIPSIIADFDTVNGSNMNRQFLFYDANGRNKAEVLVERLKPAPIVAWNKKITGTLQLQPDMTLFSCVDNNLGRYYLQLSARDSQSLLINGGSSIDGAQANAYLPGKTPCLDCQMGYTLSQSFREKNNPKRKGNCFDPSIIISNQVAAALMLTAYAHGQLGKYLSLHFTSGEGVFVNELPSKCYRGCSR